MRLPLLLAAMAALLVSAAPANAQEVPPVLPLLSLEDGTLFPDVSEEVQIIEQRSRILIDEALKGNRIIGLVTLKPEGLPNERGWLDIFPIGTVCVIDDFTRLPDGRLFVVLRAVMKFRIQQETSDRVYRSALIEPLPEGVEPADRERFRQLRLRVDELAKVADPVVLPEMDDIKRINSLAFYMDLTIFERQELLERDGMIARAQGIIDLLTMKVATRR